MSQMSMNWNCDVISIQQDGLANSRMAQWLEVPSPKPEDLSLISGIRMVGENQLLKDVSDFHIYAALPLSPVNKFTNKWKEWTTNTWYKHEWSQNYHTKWKKLGKKNSHSSWSHWREARWKKSWRLTRDGNEQRRGNRVGILERGLEICGDLFSGWWRCSTIVR